MEAVTNGPKTWGELEKLCLQNGHSRSVFARALKKLREVEKTISRELSEATGQPSKTVYVLVLEGKRGEKKSRTKAAIARFYDILGRYPDPEELALEMGDIIPKEAEDLAYQTRRHTDWRPPTKLERDSGRQETGESLILAARLKAELERNWVMPLHYTEDEVELAKYYLETYPELVPTLTKTGMFDWPNEAKRYLGGEYFPIRRGKVITSSK